MLNDGTGHFGPAIYSPVAEGTFNVTDFLLGDFRNTGSPDLVTIASYFGEGGAGTQLVYAPNAGGGSFGPPAVTQISLSGIRDYLRHSNLNVTNQYLQATSRTKRLAQEILVDAILPSGSLAVSKSILIQ
jgi:hypothetical protein